MTSSRFLGLIPLLGETDTEETRTSGSTRDFAGPSLPARSRLFGQT